MHFVKCDGCGKTDITPDEAAEVSIESHSIYFWDGQLCKECASKTSAFICALKSKDETQKGEQ